MDANDEAFIKSAAIHILSGLVKQDKTVSKKDVESAADMAFHLCEELNKRFKKLGKAKPEN